MGGQRQGLWCGWWELQTARVSVVCRNFEPNKQFQPCGSSLVLRRGCGFEVAPKFAKFVQEAIVYVPCPVAANSISNGKLERKSRVVNISVR